MHNILWGIVGFVVGFAVTAVVVLWLLDKAAAYAVGRGLGW